MAWIFLVEPGSGVYGATSYIETSFADDYNAAHPYGSDWATVANTGPLKEKFCMLASRSIDYHCLWFGQRVKGPNAGDGQGLEFPRYNLKTREGFLFDSNAIPQFLKIAVAEFARKLCVEDLTADPGKGLSALSLDVISLTFDPNDRRLVIPDEVKAMVQDYCTIRKASSWVRLRRS